MEKSNLITIKKNIEDMINNNFLEEAILLINELLKYVPNDYEVYSMYCVALIMNNNLQDAIIIAKEGLKKNYINFDLHYNLAYCYEMINDKNAIREYRKAWFYLQDDKFEEELLLKIYTLEYGCNTTEEAKEIKQYYDILEKYIISIILNKSDIDIDIDKLEKPKKIIGKKVLFGPIEIANQMNSYSKGLNENGIISYTINEYSNYLNYKSDFIIPEEEFGVKEIKKIIRLIAEFDIFHLFFGGSLIPDYSDLILYKKLNKKVVMNHWGSDVRFKSLASRINPDVKFKVNEEEKIKKRTAFLGKYIDTCIVADGELYGYVKKYYKNVKIVRQAIYTKNIKIGKDAKNSIFTIVHAPTSQEVKGTEYILNAINKLKEKYEINFITVEGMNNTDAMEVYKKADLIIDQILNGTYGIFAIECMALGKPVVCYIHNEYRDFYPSELPIISANKNDIEEVIEKLILNEENLINIGKSGIEYVKEYHESKKIAKELLNVYKDI